MELGQSLFGKIPEISLPGARRGKEREAQVLRPEAHFAGPPNPPPPQPASSQWMETWLFSGSLRTQCLSW
jgi:hypothetical protein